MEIYDKIFKRNVGVITQKEQQILKHSKVAIAGTGGVGGNVAGLLARAGVGHFKLADLDTFSVSNTNRQYGCNMECVGQSKVEVVKTELIKINPDIEIQLYPNGVTDDNLEEFIFDVAVVVDAMDMTALDIRKKLMSKVKDDIYVYLCPALGFGANMIIFGSEGMNFNEFFPETDSSGPQQILDFAYKLFPRIPDYVDIKSYMNAIKNNNYFPTFSTSVMLAAVVTANEIILNLLNRRKPKLAPFIYHLDLVEQYD